MLYDLKELKKQIEANKKALRNAVEVIGENLALVRGAGFAFLDLSNQVTSAETAEQVANKLQAMIRANAPGALSQAENLESITVAALTLDSNSLLG